MVIGHSKVAKISPTVKLLQKLQPCIGCLVDKSNDSAALKVPKNPAMYGLLSH